MSTIYTPMPGSSGALLDVNFRRQHPEGMHTPDAFDGWDTDKMNVEEYIFWRDYLTTLALSQFEWVNLPREIDARYIELTLLMQGFGAFFEKAPGVLAFCQGSQSEMLDMYYNPQEVILVASNGSGTWKRRCNDLVEYDAGGTPYVAEQNAVACFDNMLRHPMMRYIELYAHRISRVDRITDVNALAQLTPWILQTDEQGRSDVINYFKQIAGCEPAVMVMNTLAIDTTAGVLNTGAPYVADKLHDLIGDLVSDCLNMLGVDNIVGEKRERLLTSESDSNNEQLALTRRSRLECRQKAAERCNELFGTDISVKWAADRNEEGVVTLQEFGDVTGGGAGAADNNVE